MASGLDDSEAPGCAWPVRQSSTNHDPMVDVIESEDELIIFHEEEDDVEPLAAGDKSTSNAGAAAADRSTPYKICFEFLSRGFCSRTTCSSNHICEDVVPYLQAMELMASKSPDNHYKIVSVLDDMLTVASPLHKQFATHTDTDVNDFTSKLLKTIVQKNRERKHLRISRNAANLGLRANHRTSHYLDEVVYDVLCFLADERSPFVPDCITGCVEMIMPTIPTGAQSWLSSNLLKKICSHTGEKIDIRLSHGCFKTLVQLCLTTLDWPTLEKISSIVRHLRANGGNSSWFREVSDYVCAFAKRAEPKVWLRRKRVAEVFLESMECGTAAKHPKGAMTKLDHESRGK
ncbi:uncharacterized protein LOC124340535 [Daphnia pulicaria]|uniref:uncharacterized protein LOC124340535 n=1 Tax=Daphnia pulicaria TaxID=35523 RepID=UPI001EEC98B6|nr:uncharacterized protein LOC124340535 [Daphnia pulicaria]